MHRKAHNRWCSRVHQLAHTCRTPCPSLDERGVFEDSKTHWPCVTGEAIPSTHSLLPTVCKARKKRGVLWRRQFLGVARVNKVTPVSFGNPVSVFNKNSTLKERETWGRGKTTKGGSARAFGYLRTHTEFSPHTRMEFQVSVVSECIFRFAYTGICTCGCLTTPRFADDSRHGRRDRARIARHSTPIFGLPSHKRTRTPT